MRLLELRALNAGPTDILERIMVEAGLMAASGDGLLTLRVL